tara:strand:+ start:418 stop:609 length:192 start_codon:yes stop_codon:yes gene_type:complete
MIAMITHRIPPVDLARARGSTQATRELALQIKDEAAKFGLLTPTQTKAWRLRPQLSTARLRFW